MKNVAFWDVALCISCVYRRFGGTYGLNLQGRKIREPERSVSPQPPADAGSTLTDFFYPEDRGHTFLRNVGWRTIYTHPRSHSSMANTFSAGLYSYAPRSTDLYISEIRSVVHFCIKDNGGNKLSGKRNVLNGADWIPCRVGGVFWDVIFCEIINLQSTTVYPVLQREGKAEEPVKYRKEAHETLGASQCDRDISSLQSSRWSGHRLFDWRAKHNGFCMHVTYVS
jgi:hypothetical protein